MKRLAGILAALFLALPLAHAPAETVVLRSGKEIEIIDGALTAKGAEEVLREASDWLNQGRLDYARESWRLLAEKGQGAPAARAKAAQERRLDIEYQSFVVLRDGKVLTGNIKADLRTDLLGLESKLEIPIWAVEEIAAEYHPGYSRVTKTFYPLTVLEIKLRGLPLRTSRITQEVEFRIEEKNGAVSKAILGKEYEILRSENLGEQIDALTKGRILKVVIFPHLAKQDR